MKTIKLIALILLGIVCFTSCELDNYEAPGGSIYGAIIDQETGDSVQQDIFNGTRIAFVEIDEAYPNPERLYQIIKPDGSFRNDLMFEAEYAIPTIEDGNFHPSDSTSIIVSGETELLYEVLPYIRIKDASIVLNPDDMMEVIATFKLEQTVSDTIDITKVTLFADFEPTVGKTHNIDSKELSVYAAATPGQEYTIEMDSRKLKSDNAYWFRLGAQIDIDGTRMNYAQAVRLTLTKN